MITGEIRNKVDKIWTDIWAGGITNPLTVIEQFTYLMFIRSLDEKELESESFEALTGESLPKIFPQDEQGQSMRWSKFRDRDAREIYEIAGQRVFPFIKSMNGGGKAQTAFSRYMNDAMFLISAPQVLQKIITGLNELYEHDLIGLDMQGDLYEYMLGKLATAGQNGQFCTPKHIRDMMVRLLAPPPDDKICDPACGSGSMFVQTAHYIEHHKEQGKQMNLRAYGVKKTGATVKLAKMNLVLNNVRGTITEANSYYRDPYDCFEIT